jgi:NUMOD4 motif/HNH endonuclease
MNAEMWAAVPNFEGLYEVSTIGRIRSIARVVQRTKGGVTRPLSIPEKMLSLGRHKFGYPVVSLWKNNKGKTCTVHRLLAIAFIPNPDNLPEVAHIDHDTSNCTKENLKWATHKSNIADSQVENRYEPQRKAKAKLTLDQVNEIRKLSSDVSNTALGAMFGVCQPTISNILCGKTWRV